MLRSFCSSLLVVIVAVVASVLIQAGCVDDLKPYTSPISGAWLPPMAVFRAATKLSAIVDKLAFAVKPPLAQAMTLLSGYQATQAIGLFAHMRIAEAIETLNPGGASEVSSIAAVVGADADALRRLLRFLSALGFVASDGTPATTKFGNTAASKLLIKDSPGSVWGAAMSIHTNHYLGWTNLEASIKGGAGVIAFDDKFGMDYWEYLKKRPEEEEAFAHFMTGLSHGPDAAIATSGANFSECTGIVDIGGGHGSLLADVVAAHPALAGKATVLDLPSVVASAEPLPGIAFQGGDFFEPAQIPKGAATNCYILKIVLHDWAEDKCIAILNGVTQAMDSAGVPVKARKVYIAENMLMSGDPLASLKLGLDVNMLAMVGGQERTEEEWAGLLAKAGWQQVASYPTRSIYTVIEAAPGASA